MKKFFTTKKYVALILLTTMLCGFSYTGIAKAAGDHVTAYASYSTALKVADVGAGIMDATAFGILAGHLEMARSVSGFILGIAGKIFDMAISFSIIQMKNLFDNGGVLNTLWSLIRDLLNISFIFILLYIAITKIIGSWGVTAKTTIVKVIIGAIFINFSMMIAKLFIDAGNLVAVELYKAIASGGLATSVSGLIVNSSTAWQMFTALFSLTDQISIIVNLVLPIICVGFLMSIYLYCSILLIGRAAMLLFLTITSPIGFGFIGQSIPWLADISKSWWTAFIGQITVAPILMFFLYFVLRILQSSAISNLLSTNNNDSSLGANSLKYFVYLLVVVLLWQALKITKKYSGEVGEMTVKIASVSAKAIGAAVAVGAIVATAGAALGVGALGAGAAGAAGAAEAAGTAGAAGAAGEGAAAGAVGKSTWGRLSSSLKNNPLKKLYTGELSKEDGALGKLSRTFRPKILDTIKKRTNGWIDIEGRDREKEKEKIAQQNAMKEEFTSFTKKPEEGIEVINSNRSRITEQAKLEVEKSPTFIEGKKEIEQEKKNVAATQGVIDNAKKEKNGNFNYEFYEEQIKTSNERMATLAKDITKETELAEEKVAKELGAPITKKEGKNVYYGEEEEKLKTEKREGLAKQRKWLIEKQAEIDKMSGGVINNIYNTNVNGINKKELQDGLNQIKKGQTKVEKDVMKNIIKLLTESGNISSSSEVKKVVAEKKSEDASSEKTP